MRDNYERKDLEDWFDKHSEAIFKDFYTFLSFPSISSEIKHKDDMRKCCEWLCNYIDQMGLSSEIIETPSYPLIFAEDKRAGKDKPTLLIYGHYDVQPVDPIEEWKSKPFEADQRDGEIFARGAQDNKGQIFYTLFAIKCFLEKNEPPPINIKLCIDGEEENNSIGLLKKLSEIKEKLKATYLLVPDMGITEKNSPAITLGVRGMCQMTLKMQGSNGDLHSGEFGGIAYNPLKATVELLSKLWDKDGKVVIPGFYDGIKPITDEEKSELDLSFDREKYEKSFGITSFFKEDDFSQKESNWLRPTLEINGIGGGYFKEGFKTVIPASVVVKISCRLVYDQDPYKIANNIKEYLLKNVEKGMKLTVDIGQGGLSTRGDSKSKLAKAVEMAYTEVYGKPCKKIFSGGSVPIIAEIVKAIDCNVLLMGLGLPDDNIHAPNEHFGKDRMKKGFLIIEKSLEGLASQK